MPYIQLENALAKVKDEKGMKRVEKFLKRGICLTDHGTRLQKSKKAKAEMDIPSMQSVP